MTQPPPWPQQPDGPPPQPSDGPPPQQQPAQQPPQQPQSPYGSPGPGYGYPQGGQPVADNPYAQQAPQSPQAQPYQPYQQPPPFPQQPQQTAPYGGYPSPPPPPPPPGPPVPASASGAGKRRAGLIAGGVLVALALVGGGVWFAFGHGGGDDAKAPTAHGSPGTSETTPGVTDDPTAPEPPVAGPSAEGSAGEGSSSVPDLPTPTGTGLQAVWRAPDSTMLALGDAYEDEPRRVNAVLSDGSGFECKGRWQKDDGGGLVVALLCEQDGTKAEDKDRLGEIEQSGDTLTVTWKKGTTGTESFERFRDMDPA
ncbi:hypothetical protein [Streptomyces sp. NTK 937]|uniref:hypothetical protein n=1 Tax=Streptomyces sp. NTK 937 TaxID=1487711 RepID=UPI0004A95CB1|nr:hypothetical protein [Streptomyces sp. NTK 937]KDQ68739.1 hypothetical protein DT87_16555 [Streptomyces sp. NTK 937]